MSGIFYQTCLGDQHPHYQSLKHNLSDSEGLHTQGRLTGLLLEDFAVFMHNRLVACELLLR